MVKLHVLHGIEFRAACSDCCAIPSGAAASDRYRPIVARHVIFLALPVSASDAGEADYCQTISDY
ncbi:hypothetical protein FFK22_040165 [Mycobacterium sp. KBS0706]|uniref:hypothetical protein n=1 Tax=Mycobacterium sp. KBS0706 TaxID=2578109 RepID=UPI00110FC1A1|nr:hypothetical protein [Mycobacterium sp. KBS0706]TSD82975.1 hypothetical protein FFK22_040165 [Mycobacterium sp. KBS0706]